ncbi:MAG: hypothetical protein EA408_06605 [Marinilabiliales bacterium]|nr:MAG: hypothetical protein EA408_06605 [Marinilabiliales bacterium]
MTTTGAMRKYRYHMAAVLLLALLVVLIRHYRGATTLGKWETRFAVKNYERVDRIVICDGNSEIKLEREGDIWILNSRFEARKEAVDMLLQTFGRLRVSSPVPLSQRDDVMKSLAEEAVTVEAAAGRRSRKFRVWSPGQGSPTYMIRDGYGQPYIVDIIGFEGHVASVFVVDQGYWRPNVLFSYRPGDISEVVVHHREDTDGSFVLRQPQRQHYRLFAYPGNDEYDGINDSLVIRFLSNFIYVPFERPAREDEALMADSLLVAGHDHYIRVTCREGYVSELSLHRIISGYEDGDPVFDIFRLHGISDGGADMVVVPYHSVDLLLRSSSYFLREGR